MLSDELKQLLTAYVDGELSARQRKAVLRLLQRSAEARTLLRKLQEDADRVRSLPRRRLPEDFAANLGRQLPSRSPTRHPLDPALTTFPFWGSVAAAAVLLIGVGVASFAYFTRPLPGPTGDLLVANDSRSTPEVGPPTPPPSGPPDREMIQVPPTVVAQGSPEPVGPQKPGGPDVPPVNTVPLDDMEMFKPVVAQVNLSPLVEVHKIDAALLTKVLERDAAYRIELPCRETNKGFRLLETAFKEAGTSLVVEKEAQNRLSKPRLRTHYIVFLEDVTPQELARVLARVGTDDKKEGEAKPKSGAQFSKMVVSAMSDADRRELFDLLRADTRPEAIRANGKAAERLGLAVTYNPVRPTPGSADVRRFFENRKPPRPGTIQVLLVLRELGQG